MDNGKEQEILVPAVYVNTIMIPAAGHEAGHAVVAHHYCARVIGIAVGFIPERTDQGVLVHTIYEDKSDWSTETRCVVKAAGPAADLLISGAINEQGASGDLQDIQALTGSASLEPYLSTAKEILAARREQLACITAALRQKLLERICIRHTLSRQCQGGGGKGTENRAPNRVPEEKAKAPHECCACASTLGLNLLLDPTSWRSIPAGVRSYVGR